MAVKKFHNLIMKIIRDGGQSRQAAKGTKIIISAALTLSLMISVLSTADICLAYEVTVNGDTVGYVNSTRTLEQACSVNGSSESVNRVKALKENAALSLTVVSEGKLADAAKLRNEIVNSSDELFYGFALIADGKATAAFEKEESIKAALAKVCASHKYNSDTFSSRLLTKTKIEKGVFESGIKCDNEAELFNAVDSSLVYEYTKTEVTTRTTPYTSKVVYDKQKYTCYKKVKRQGSVGVTIIKTEKKYIGKNMVSEDVVSKETVSEPIEKIIVKGTKDKAVAETATIPGYGNSVVINEPTGGQLMWPVSDSGAYMYVSAYFGDGRNHKGFDIAAPCGTPIFAADSGTVVSAYYDNSGYGNLIVIDHGNGISTAYSHCSTMYVKAGDKVSAGSEIGAVGYTGNATGSHLHFEVRQNGYVVNPAAYLGLS